MMLGKQFMTFLEIKRGEKLFFMCLLFPQMLHFKILIRLDHNSYPCAKCLPDPSSGFSHALINQSISLPSCTRKYYK